MKQFQYHDAGLVPNDLFALASPWSGDLAAAYKHDLIVIEPDYYRTFLRYYADT